MKVLLIFHPNSWNEKEIDILLQELKEIADGRKNKQIMLEIEKRKIEERKVNKKYHMVIIVSNDFEEIKETMYTIKKEIPVLILTENINTKFIMQCISVTNYISHIKRDREIILEKMIKMVESAEAHKMKKSIEINDKKNKD